MKSSSAGALAREALNPVRKSSRPGMLRLRRILLPKVRAEAPVHGRFATSSIRSGGLDRLSGSRFGELWHFPGNRLRTSVLYAGFLVFGLRLRALALPALLRRMQQRGVEVHESGDRVQLLSFL